MSRLLPRVLSPALLALLLIPAPLAAQAGTAAPTSPQRLRVFLDCFDCYAEYLRDQVDWVDFVVVPEDADVHLLSSDTDTGGGGQEVVLRFVGRGRFAGDDVDFRAIVPPNESQNQQRALVFQTVVAGLLHYIAQAGLPPGLELSVDNAALPQASIVTRSDPWNLWVFELSGGGSIDAEETTREVEWDANATADRVSEAWKISFGLNLFQSSERFELDDDQPLEVTQRNRSFNAFVARSMGPHLSFGLTGRAASSTFGNTAFTARLAPAVEYSIFPYEEYATRQFRLQYNIGVERAQYEEVTLFDKLEETLLQHQAMVNIQQQQPWGEIELGTEFSQYLHDAGLYRLEVDGEISLRITRGLALEIEGNASRVRDQISLPRRGATSEEVLLELRELFSGYQVRFEIGLSYTFGSLFNNIVNPRFSNVGGGGGGDFD